MGKSKDDRNERKGIRRDERTSAPWTRDADATSAAYADAVKRGDVAGQVAHGEREKWHRGGGW